MFKGQFNNKSDLTFVFLDYVYIGDYLNGMLLYYIYYSEKGDVNYFVLQNISISYSFVFRTK